MPTDDIHPFTVDIAEEDVRDLRARLRGTRWPPLTGRDDWERGVPAGYLRDLAEYWADGFDWPAQQARMNSFAQFTTTIDDQLIHFLHVRSPEPDALPLLLTHGWPGSVMEFADVVGPLTDPVRHGGRPSDAFHVVVPALPGYGFSTPLTGTGWTISRIAQAWVVLMDRLGYSRFGTQGGDWGSPVSRAVGVAAPDRVAGVHLNAYFGPAPKEAAAFDGLSELELAHDAARRRFIKDGRGYQLLQATRPDTIGYALTDSPVGQLAWILEKFWEWTDSTDSPEDAVDRDAILTDVSIYWFTRSAGSSAQLYWESRHESGPPAASPVPTALANFAHDIAPAIRRFVERDTTITRWTEFERGGHFAALEQPEALVDDIRAFFAELR